MAVIVDCYIAFIASVGTDWSIRIIIHHRLLYLVLKKLDVAIDSDETINGRFLATDFIKLAAENTIIYACSKATMM